MRSRRLAVVAVSALAGTATAGIAIAPGANAAPAPHTASAQPASAQASVGVGKVFVSAWTTGLYKGEPGAAAPTLFTTDGSTINLPSGQANYPTFSPDGSRIAYVDEHGALISVRSDGSDKIVLDGRAGHRYPTFADNGAVVVFEMGESLYSVPSVGGPITEVPGAGGLSVWGPSGGRGSFIVRVRASNIGGTVIEKVDLHSGTVTQLSNPATNGGSYTHLALSPDGSKVAFTASVAVGDVQMGNGFFGTDIFTVPTDGSAVGSGKNPTRYTNGLVNNPVQGGPTYLNADEPSWSPDGSKIGFLIEPNGNTYNDTYKNPFYLPTNAPGSAPITLGNFQIPARMQAMTGAPIWQPIGHDLVQRLAGDDRVGTAVQASTWAWSTAGQPDGRKQAKVAVLSRSDLFADALAGSSLAAHAGGPLLLTSTTGLDAATRAELKRSLTPGSPVYLLGGTAALSPAVEDAVRSAGFTPVRLYGANRYETAVSVANEIGRLSPSVKPKVLLATAQNFPDALAAGAAAGATPGGVVLLTQDTVMPKTTSTWLGAHTSAATWAVGHQADDAAKSAHIAETPLAGDDRYLTAAAVAHAFFPGSKVAGLATGFTWPDALAGGALMGAYGGPLLLTSQNLLATSTASYLTDSSASISTLLVFGGPNAVSDAATHPAGDAIGLPGTARYVTNDQTQR